MARGFFIIDIEITDPKRYQQYLDGVRGVVNAAGGRVIVGADSKRRRPVEGEWNPKRFVIVEFPSYEAAETFYFSDAYQAPLQHRLAASVSRGFLIEEQ